MLVATRQKIIDAALNAACEASTDASSHLIAGRNVGPLNEQWVQSYVGVRLNDLLRSEYDSKDVSFVTFETCVSWLEDFYGVARGPGPKPGSLTDRQRFDVVAWSKGGSVAGLVEIKDQPHMQAYSRTADAKKLSAALKRWPSIRWGLFLFSVRSRKVDAKAVEQDLNGKCDAVFAAIGEAVPQNTIQTSIRTVHGRGSLMAWGGVLLAPKRKAS